MVEVKKIKHKENVSPIATCIFSPQERRGNALISSDYVIEK